MIATSRDHGQNDNVTRLSCAGDRRGPDPRPVLPEPSALLEEIDRIRAQARVDAARQVEKWRGWRIDPDFLPAAENLAAYLALRHYDLRAVQRDLMALGLSSLGRLESRVLPTLDAVAGALAALRGALAREGPRTKARTRTPFSPESASFSPAAAPCLESPPATG